MGPAIGHVCYSQTPPKRLLSRASQITPPSQGPTTYQALPIPPPSQDFKRFQHLRYPKSPQRP